MLEAMQKPNHSTRHCQLPRSWSRSLSVLILAALATGSRADDWMTWASSYTHSPQTGERVDQYAQTEQPISPYRQDFTRSGYRHFRSTLQAGQSADNIHIVEQWGQPIVPYEQWRFPFRPYAVPYDAWGPQAPYGIMNGLFQSGQGGANWHGHAGRHTPPGYEGGYGGDHRLPGHPGQAGAGHPAGSTAGPASRPGHPADAGNWGGYPSGGHGPRANAPYGSRGFPLTPTYDNEPWYDGAYPTVPPLNER